MRVTLWRILAIWIGLAVITALYSHYYRAASFAAPSATILFGLLLLVAVLLGLAVELIPWPRRFTPAWGEVGVSVLLLGLLYCLHTFWFMWMLNLKLNPAILAMIENRWAAPILAILLGNLIGKALTKQTDGAPH